jgi:rod shape determining protein RodA
MNRTQQSLIQRFNLDPVLLSFIFTLLLFAQLVLFSASGGSFALIQRQFLHIALASIIMVILAQIQPRYFKQWAPYLYTFGILLLIAVLIIGHTGKGAQRWLNLGVVRFQPSELLKIACPMMLAFYLSNKQLPLKNILVSGSFLIVPTLLIAKQPDLGTAMLIASSGLFVIFFAGIRWRYIITAILTSMLLLPIVWLFLHDYQKQRIFTFFSPEKDPLGSGYHIMQSKIAIGSGGLLGKGWLNGSQAHLQFLPEKTTDFVFAVLGEEFGLFGAVILLIIYSLILLRCIDISNKAQDTFSRLTAGSLSMAFFIYIFVNIGMVSGMLPVVGLPLPLVSYGGTSMVTIMAAFGIIMSIRSHRKLLDS